MMSLRLLNSTVGKQSSSYFFLKRRFLHFFLLFLFYGLYLFAAKIANFHDLFLQLSRIPSIFCWLFKNFFPDKSSLSYFPVILKSCFFTFSAALSATTLSAFIAFFLALFSAKTTKISRIIGFLLTAFSSFLRNVPLVAWSILLLFSFKQNEFTGFLALFLITSGHLTRIFRDIIDNTSAECFYALRAMNVPYLTAIVQAVIPNVKSELLSWLLFLIETNVRDSTLIGILTGGGAGFLFNLYFRSFRYNEAGLVIFTLLCFVLLLDFLTNKVRKILL